MDHSCLNTLRESRDELLDRASAIGAHSAGRGASTNSRSRLWMPST